jgi:site-specific DNA-methyltransferase (adenine-specific)
MRRSSARFSSLNLLIIDPPYNLNKKFGNSKFSKTSSEVYEDWLDSMDNEDKRCLKKTASLYVCCDLAIIEIGANSL